MIALLVAFIAGLASLLVMIRDVVVPRLRRHSSPELPKARVL